MKPLIDDINYYQLNKRLLKQAMGREVASNLNTAFGGRKFAVGGPINPFDTAGISQSSPGQIPQASSVSLTDLSEMEETLRGLRQDMQEFKEEISEWQRNLKTNINLQEVDEGLRVIHTVEDESKM